MGRISHNLDKGKNLSIAARAVAEAQSLATSDPEEAARKRAIAERICAHFGESLETLASAMAHTAAPTNTIADIAPPVARHTPAANTTTGQAAPPNNLGSLEDSLAAQIVALAGFGPSDNQSAWGPSPGEGGGHRASGPITDAQPPAHHQPGAGITLTARAAAPGDADGLAAEIAALAGFGITSSKKPPAALVVAGGPSQGGQGETGAVIISSPPPSSPTTQAGAEQIANEIAALAGFRSSSDAPPKAWRGSGGRIGPVPPVKP